MISLQLRMPSWAVPEEIRDGRLVWTLDRCPTCGSRREHTLDVPRRSVAYDCPYCGHHVEYSFDDPKMLEEFDESRAPRTFAEAAKRIAERDRADEATGRD